jgi:hypothetical protein
MFNLRSGLKAEWIDTDLPDNTAGWRSEWFYIADQIPGLPRCTGHMPVKISEWDLGLPTRDLEDLKEVLELVSDLLTPKISTGKELTCGPSLVAKYHSSRKIFSEDSVKDACGRQCAIIRQKDCLRF